MKLIDKLINVLKRDPCKNCDYYNMDNNPKGWCQSKKVSNNGNGRVTFIDRLVCEPYNDNSIKKDN